MTFFSYRLAITPTSPLPLQRLFSVKSFISFGCQPLGWCHLGAVRSPPAGSGATDNIIIL